MRQIKRQLLKTEASRNQLLACDLAKSAFPEATKIIASHDAEMTEIIEEMQHVQTPLESLFSTCSPLT